jgi:DOPA 4,5-dioxygenase
MRMRTLIAERFAVDMGRLFEAPVGPHSKPQYEVGFDLALFSRLVPWLMLNHAGLSIMIHPNTDRELADHAESVLWLGEVLPLSYTRLQPSLLANGWAKPRDVVVNTVPTIEP